MIKQDSYPTEHKKISKTPLPSGEIFAMPILIKLLPAVNTSSEDSGFHNAGNAMHDSLNIHEDKTKHQQQQNNPPDCKGWLVGCFGLLVFVFYEIKQLSDLKSV